MAADVLLLWFHRLLNVVVNVGMQDWVSGVGVLFFCSWSLSFFFPPTTIILREKELYSVTVGNNVGGVPPRLSN